MKANGIVCALLIGAILTAAVSCAPRETTGTKAISDTQTTAYTNETPKSMAQASSLDKTTSNEREEPHLQCRKEGDGGILAVWWWNAATAVSKNTREKYLDFLSENAINRVYLCMPDTRFGELPAIIRAMKKRGIEVCLLAGDASYIQPDHAGFARLFNAYLDYQRSAPDCEKLSALHLDVEPHQLADYAEKKDEYIGAYADFVVKTARILHENGEELELDLPFWYDGLTVREGEREVELLDLLARSADTLTLMTSRDNEKELLLFSQREIELCGIYGKTVICGVEASSPEGENVSFREEGREKMYGVMTAVYGRLAEKTGMNGYGMAIHHLDSWYKLQN